MKTKPDVDAAGRFVWQNARLLDRHRYSYLFENAPSAPVRTALAAYQNPDGGFGNALEPDLRTPASQPVPAELAVRILDEIGELDEAASGPICDWLSSVTTEEGGVPFVLPSAAGYPHAPWWTPPENSAASLNPTSALAGIMAGRGIAHPWVGRACEYTWRAIEDLDELEPHLLVCVLTFLERVPDRDRAEKTFAQLGPRILESGVVALDPHAGGYVHSPLDLAPTPGSIARDLFDNATIGAHLDALSAKQEPDGGWPIAWEPPSAAATFEWRGSVTVRTLALLRAYDRL